MGKKSDPSCISKKFIYPFQNHMTIPSFIEPEHETNKKAQERSDIIGWLDNQPRSSVIFLCFENRGSFKKDEVSEIARALQNCGFRFLWSLLKPSPEGLMMSSSDYSDLSEILPEGFVERMATIGKFIEWALQTDILAHEAIGGFVSHCRWNSILESIYFGVPIATWPLYADKC
ncbi:putative UDP-glucose flavonoid 3-O-glucosyltransferase 3 [Senna tora]|uniref:Putative UDP-glucose flavonoid 3-O-glucosyltransferase 3 n=1 Tax=Senna tora TaxID=362788 RepID=A0A834WP81_9FABA|nr:putative UDP-glucose flavonoid 3-O-glucosyltransferase 3 [Senna tora]